MIKLLKKDFRSFIENFLNKGKCKIFFNSAYESNGFVVIEVIYAKTNEKSKFLFKDFNWYTIPYMEEINYGSELYKILSDLKNKWLKGFYDIESPSNSLKYLNSD